MLRHGRPRTPTAILKARGSKWAKARPQEPQLPAEIPPKPDKGDARVDALWHTVSQRLFAHGICTELDGEALYRYCEISVWRDDLVAIVAEFKGRGFHVVKTPSGERVWPLPHLAVIADMESRMFKLEQEFGMVPASRSRVHVAEGKGTVVDTEGTTRRL